MIIAPGFVGIDVSKHRLDVFDAAFDKPTRLANTASAVAELAQDWARRDAFVLFERPDGNQYISMWEQTYLMHAIDRARQQGFAGGLAHRDAIAKFQLKLFASDPDYPRAQGAPYIVAVGVPGASSTL